MSVISNDFAGALREVRIAVSTLAAENAALKLEVADIKKKLAATQQQTVDAQNRSVLLAAATSNQEQLQALSQQPLPAKQAEMIRLSLIPSSEAPVGPFQPNPLVDRYIESRRGQGSLPADSRTQYVQQEDQASRQRLFDQLKANNAEAARVRQEQALLQALKAQSDAAEYKQNNNALGAINPRFSVFDVENY